VQGVEPWHVRIEESQRDLDRLFAYYNVELTHQGYRLNGSTLRERSAATLDWSDA
jgi:hypothetical protein